jgi:hypothetical protein
MAQTFDIRFARSDGLAALFEAPTNVFRWKGAGRLSIDASGVDIAAQRGLMTLFARALSRRIAANSLIEVYREGNALRLEFSTRESSRNVLPFWASDRQAAAEIVTLLPTQRSVELEDAAVSTRRYRFDRRLILISVGVVVLGAAGLTLQRYFADGSAKHVVAGIARPAEENSPPAVRDVPTMQPTPPILETRSRDGAASAAVANDAPVPLYLDPPQLPELSPIPAAEAEIAEGAAPEGIFPIVQGDPAYEVARRQLDLFLAESTALHADYAYARDFSNYSRLEIIAEGWGKVTSRIYDTVEFAGPAFHGLRELELAISRGWRAYLYWYAANLRDGDKRVIEESLAHLEFVETLEALLPEYVR